MTAARASVPPLIYVAFAIWGGNWVAFKAAEGAGVPALEFAALRADRAALALLAFVLATRRSLRVPRPLTGAVAGSALTTIAFFALSYEGAIRLSGALASLLANSSPLFAVILAVTMLRERVTRENLGGLAISALGLLVIASPALVDRSFDVRGMGVVLLGSIALAFNTVYMRRAAVIDPLVGNTYQFIGAGIALTAIAAAFGTLRPVPPVVPAWASLLYVTVLGSAISYGIWSRCLDRIGAARAGSMIFLVPVAGHLWAWTILREPVVPIEVIGATIVTLGTIFASRAPKAPNLVVA